MFFSIKLDLNVSSPSKHRETIKDEEPVMSWSDDEAYSYTFEEDWEEQGTAIPPMPDCLRGDLAEQQSVDEEELFYEKANVHYKKPPMRGVSPGRAKQLRTLYQSVVRLNHERNDNTFAEKAQQLAALAGEKTRHVPFRSYWPTYDAMSQKQKEWYFYLRSQLREGKYPKTDLSYLFVYIYELINQVGVKDAADGLIQLCGLWSAYRAEYSVLDKYLVLWVQDYILIYAGGDFTTMMAQIPDRSLISLFPDSLAGCLMENPEAGFTLEFISRFSDYRFYTGQLAQSSQGGLFLSLLPSVFQQINQTMIQEKGKGIFGTYRPSQSSGKRRIAFQNAIYSGQITSVCQDEMPYSSFAPLRSFFTSVIKETENRLREQAQIRGRLRGISLEPKVLSLIQALVMKQLCQTVAEEEKQKLQVDRDRIIQLLQESNLIRQRLLEGIEEMTSGTGTQGGLFTAEEGSSAGGADCLAGNSSMQKEEAMQKGHANKPTVQTGLHSSACGESSAELFRQGLSESQQGLVSFIVQNGGEVGEGLIGHAFPQLFLELEMDEINQHAMDALGDIILTREGGLWLLYEDYRAELEGVFI